MESIICTLDQAGDVLYVRARDAAIFASKPIPGDDFVILNMDRDGRVVGIQVIDVQEMTVGRWREFFHTPEIPEALFSAVSDFLAADPRPSHSGMHSRRAAG